ncbi:homocysteine S-methyltransferase [Mobilicoccus pelagius]|nr:homocysteine S-methyltransferase [Mobilicoccus pelagius]
MTSRPVDLLGGEVWVADGGLATQLEAMGHDLIDALWSARLLHDDPEAIVEAHLHFLRAGARIVTTASYQATDEGFAAAGMDADETTQFLRRSVDLAREAVDRHVADGGTRALVAASVGPYGAMLADGSEYRGRYGLTVADLREFHARRVDVLAGEVADGGADLLALETIPDVDEVVALTDLLGAAGVPGWVSCTVEAGRTRAGQPLADAVAAAADTGEVVAIGANCCAPRDVEAVLDAVATAGRGRPAVVYPNSGEGWDARARTWTGTGTDLAALAPGWVEAGARIVGGCCRVGPDRIAALARAVTKSTRVN